MRGGNGNDLFENTRADSNLDETGQNQRENSQSSFVPLENLSAEARAVYDAGLELWKYYHSMPDASADASFYDIRKYFQGTNASGKMNASSDDARYTELIAALREKMKTLGARIAEKVYEYGFLK